MKKFNSIDYLIFVLLLSVTITNAERSWRETAGEWTETGKEYRKSAFNAVRNNRKTAIAIGVGFGVLTAAYMARARFTKGWNNTTKWIKTNWEDYAPERLGGKRKLTQQEQLYQQTNTNLQRFNVLKATETYKRLTDEEQREIETIQPQLISRYKELGAKKGTSTEQAQLELLSEALN